MKKNHYIPHEWNVTCDVCSKKIKASDAKQRWDGLIVCPEDYEQRHTQDFVIAKQDKFTVPFSRPRPPDVFTTVSYPLYVDTNYVKEGYILETVPL